MPCSDTVEFLAATEGAKVSWLEVDDFGRVHADTLAAAIGENPTDVAVVTVMWANNEVGTVNPIRELADVARAHAIPFHTDAVQALGQLPLDFCASGADALTVTGHKVGGPTGTGLLLLRRDIAVVPLMQGGGQERAVRSGTLDVAGIVGLAVAVQDAVTHRAERAAAAGGPPGRSGRRGDRGGAERRCCPAIPVSRWSTAGRPGCPATPICGSPAARATRC